MERCIPALVEPNEEKNLEQTIAITSKSSSRQPASEIIMYGSYWFRMGSGYTQVLNDCLAILMVQEGIRQVLFYADENSFPHGSDGQNSLFFSIFRL